MRPSPSDSSLVSEERHRVIRPTMPSFAKSLRGYLRAFSAPLLLWAILGFFLYQPISQWLAGDQEYDEAALQEWVEESRGLRDTLPEMIDSYLRQTADLARLEQASAAGDRDAQEKKLFAQFVIFKKQ